MEIYFNIVAGMQSTAYHRFKDYHRYILEVSRKEIMF